MLGLAKYEVDQLPKLPCERSRGTIQRALKYLGEVEAHRKAAGRGRTRAEKGKRQEILIRELDLGEKIDSKLSSCLRDW
jgi:hypothetical protein